MPHKPQQISIWFFIGVLLLIYGVLILGAGIFSPAADTIVLSNLHAAIWWGALILVMGAVYTYLFRPNKRTNQ